MSVNREVDKHKVIYSYHNYRERTRFELVYFFNFLFFGLTMQFTGSQFPEQRLNLCLSGEARSPNHWTTREFPVLRLCRLGNGLPDSSVGKESTYNAGDPGLIPGAGRSAGEGIGYALQYSWASLVAQLVRNPPAIWETWVRSLGWEDPLDKGKATHSVFWPGEFHELYSPWGHKELDIAEWLSLSLLGK